MSYEDFGKLKALYTQLIELVCYAKEINSKDECLDCFLKMFQVVRECLKFSPYTHFYTQVLIDIIVKTYNTKVFRSDLLFKSEIGVFIENPKYSPNEIFENWEENEYTREYKRMHGLHYNHTKVFKEKQFKEWSKKARELRDTYTDEQIEEFKQKLQKLSKIYCKK